MMLLKVIPFDPAYSIAKFLVKISSAALLAPYSANNPPMVTLAALDVRLMILPPFLITGSAA